MLAAVEGSTQLEVQVLPEVAAARGDPAASAILPIAAIMETKIRTINNPLSWVRSSPTPSPAAT